MPATTPLRIGSLFAGIGGLELGLEAGLHDAGLAAGTVWQVECNPYAREVLAKYWPTAPRYDDVTTVGAASLSPVDILCGGSPCPDLSKAGKRAGFAGPRSGLWKEFARLIGELRPALVVWENVAGALCPSPDRATGGRVPSAVATVLYDLDGLGYDSVWTVLSAALVGATHLRERVFVIAGRRDRQRPPASRERVVESRTHTDRTPDHWTTPPGRKPPPDEPPREIRAAKAVPYHQERIEALGNCVVPQVAYLVGRVLASFWTGGAPQVLPATATPLQRLGCSVVGAMEQLEAAPETMAYVNLRTAAWAGPVGGGTPPPLCRTWPTSGRVREGRVEPHPVLPVTPLQVCSVAACGGADPVVEPGRWPTATARDWKSGKASAATRSRNARPLSEEAAPGGFLNPPWVEQHMGLPVGYTAIAPGRVTQRLRGKKAC